MKIDQLYDVILDQFLSIVTLRFVASHMITGSFTEISALSGEIFCAKISQNPIHTDAKIPSTNFFILRIIEIKVNESDYFLYYLNFR